MLCKTVEGGFFERFERFEGVERGAGENKHLKFFVFIFFVHNCWGEKLEGGEKKKGGIESLKGKERELKRGLSKKT